MDALQLESPTPPPETRGRTADVDRSAAGYTPIILWADKFLLFKLQRLARGAHSSTAAVLVSLIVQAYLALERHEASVRTLPLSPGPQKEFVFAADGPKPPPPIVAPPDVDALAARTKTLTQCAQTVLERGRDLGRKGRVDTLTEERIAKVLARLPLPDDLTDHEGHELQRMLTVAFNRGASGRLKRAAVTSTKSSSPASKSSSSTSTRSKPSRSSTTSTPASTSSSPASKFEKGQLVDVVSGVTQFGKRGVIADLKSAWGKDVALVRFHLGELPEGHKRTLSIPLSDLRVVPRETNPLFAGPNARDLFKVGEEVEGSGVRGTVRTLGDLTVCVATGPDDIGRWLPIDTLKKVGAP